MSNYEILPIKTRILTHNDDIVLAIKEYCQAKVGKNDVIGIAFLDISTGEFFAAQGDIAYIDKTIQSFAPSEVLFCKKEKQQFTAHFGDRFHTYQLDDWCFGYDDSKSF